MCRLVAAAAKEFRVLRGRAKRREAPKLEGGRCEAKNVTFKGVRGERAPRDSPRWRSGSVQGFDGVGRTR